VRYLFCRVESGAILGEGSACRITPTISTKNVDVPLDIVAFYAIFSFRHFLIVTFYAISADLQSIRFEYSLLY